VGGRWGQTRSYTSYFAYCLWQVVGERRAEHKFLLTAWAFLPDHWHAILYPPYPLTISRVMEAIKDGATKRMRRQRREFGTLF